VTPDSLQISIAIPSDWAGATTNSRFHADSPGRVAQLDIAAAATSLPFTTAEANFVAAQRRRLASAPHASVTTRRLTVGKVPAVEVLTRYQGFTAALAGQVREFIYVFEHGGMFYAVGYTTTSDWVAKERPFFDASIRSLRFVNVA